MTCEAGEPIGPKLTRPGRPWAREKLEFLRYYLGGTGHRGGGFMSATQRAGRRYYVDLFAGPGQVEMEDGEILDGSPLIAAKATPPFTRLFWVDANRRNAASLRAYRLDYPDRRIDVYWGDANVVIDEILGELPRVFPVLAFIDPEGSEADWATIRKLATYKAAGRPKIEIFLLFPSDTGIIRFFPRDPSRMRHQDKLDRMLPSPAAWRTLYRQRNAISTAEFRRRLLGEYVTGLRDLGYRHVPDPRLVCRPDGRPLYFMIFATDHDAGLSIMSAALERVASTARQTSFLPYGQRY